MKKIVIYADGTWNTPANIENGKVASTNVYKLFKNTCDEYDDGGSKIRQVKYYAEGVGTSPGTDKITGGLFGRGINENIIEVYRFIVEHYEPGDEIYLFGFSRGAYTVRSVAGLIRNSGILKWQYHQKIERAFEIYRSREEKDRHDSPQSKFFRESFCHEDKSEIKFIGVWDTVGSLGVPFRFFSLRRKHRFHDVEIGSHIKYAYHAVSIDERRVFFRPSLWEQDKEHKHQTLEQVWFNGVHCDVGGGYPDGDISIVPLLYLQQRAEEKGLHFKKQPAQEEIKTAIGLGNHNSKDKFYYKIFPDYFRIINNHNKHTLTFFQRLGIWYLKLILEETYRKKKGNKTKTLYTHEYIHESVCLRYEKNPGGLPVNLHPIYDSLIKDNRVIGLDGKVKV